MAVRLTSPAYASLRGGSFTAQLVNLIVFLVLVWSYARHVSGKNVYTDNWSNKRSNMLDKRRASAAPPRTSRRSPDDLGGHMLIVVEVPYLHLPSCVMPRASSINAKPFAKPRTWAIMLMSFVVQGNKPRYRGLTYACVRPIASPSLD